MVTERAYILTFINKQEKTRIYGVTQQEYILTFINKQGKTRIYGN